MVDKIIGCLTDSSLKLGLQHDGLHERLTALVKIKIERCAAKLYSHFDVE